MSENSNNKIVVKVKNASFGKDFIGVVCKSENENDIGKKAFLPYVIDKEEVEAKILEDKNSFFKAIAEKLLQESAFRIKPKCPYFYVCGGCHYQHISYPHQVELKKKVVKDYLSFQTKINLEFEIKELKVNSNDGFSYRKRASFHIDESGKIGFFKGETRDVVEIEDCNILSKKVSNFFKIAKDKIKSIATNFYLLVIDDDGKEGDEPSVVLHVRDEKEILEKVRRDDFNLLKSLNFQRLIIKHREKIIYKNFSDDEASGHFSQVNREANESLVNFVLENVTSKKITELYGGSGNFSFPLFKNGKEIVVVELDKKLVSLGERRAKKLGIQNKLKFIQSSCENFVKKNTLCECVILDPPRSGAKEIVKHFSKNDTKEIIYISCNLSSFQRDLKILLDKGYNLQTLKVLDMFPQTYHIEIVAVLR